MKKGFEGAPLDEEEEGKVEEMRVRIRRLQEELAAQGYPFVLEENLNEFVVRVNSAEGKERELHFAKKDQFPLLNRERKRTKDYDVDEVIRARILDPEANAYEFARAYRESKARERKG